MKLVQRKGAAKEEIHDEFRTAHAEKSDRKSLEKEQRTKPVSTLDQHHRSHHKGTSDDKRPRRTSSVSSRSRDDTTKKKRSRIRQVLDLL